jgi:hypothetical protein
VSLEIFDHFEKLFLIVKSRIANCQKSMKFNKFLSFHAQIFFNKISKVSKNRYKLHESSLKKESKTNKDVTIHFSLFNPSDAVLNVKYFQNNFKIQPEIDYVTFYIFSKPFD